MIDIITIVRQGGKLDCDMHGYHSDHRLEPCPECGGGANRCIDCVDQDGWIVVCNKCYPKSAVEDSEA